MSVIGTKRTSASCTAHVRYWGPSGHHVLHCTCLLLTQSGHQRPHSRPLSQWRLVSINCHNGAARSGGRDYLRPNSRIQSSAERAPLVTLEIQSQVSTRHFLIAISSSARAFLSASGEAAPPMFTRVTCFAMTPKGPFSTNRPLSFSLFAPTTCLTELGCVDARGKTTSIS